MKGRIEYYGGDLHAADCIYHHACSVNFRNGKNLPAQMRGDDTAAMRKKGGRQKDVDQEQAFLKMCSYLDANNEGQLIISDPCDNMSEYLDHKVSVSYAASYLKRKLQDHYNDSNFIAEKEKLSDMVTFREQTSFILRSYYRNEQREDDDETQKKFIIKTAAKLIQSDIKSNVASVTDCYPEADQLEVASAISFLPEALKMMLQTFFVRKDTKVKVASIGQAIFYAVRPSAVIAPLQIGLAVQVHHLYRSKFLVDTLNSMKYYSSYGEVLLFRHNAANAIIPELLVESIDAPESLLISFAAVSNGDRKKKFMLFSFVYSLKLQEDILLVSTFCSLITPFIFVVVIVDIDVYFP